jgi:hypothetical protein
LRSEAPVHRTGIPSSLELRKQQCPHTERDRACRHKNEKGSQPPERAKRPVPSHLQASARLPGTSTLANKPRGVASINMRRSVVQCASPTTPTFMTVRPSSNYARAWMPVVGRRAFLAATATLIAAFSQPYRTQSQTSRTRLILLGTGGGPRPRKASSASAQVIIRNDAAYVIDCGNGVARQLVFADVPRCVTSS